MGNVEDKSSGTDQSWLNSGDAEESWINDLKS